MFWLGGARYHEICLNLTKGFKLSEEKINAENNAELKYLDPRRRI